MWGIIVYPPQERIVVDILEELVSRLMEHPPAWREIWYASEDFPSGAAIVIRAMYNDEEQVGKLTATLIRMRLPEDTIGGSYRYTRDVTPWPSVFVLQVHTTHGNYPDVIVESQTWVNDHMDEWKRAVRDIVQQIKDNPHGKPVNDLFED